MGGVAQEQKSSRYVYLDILRGATLISMIAYHTIWDLVYIKGWDIQWFATDLGYVWQQSICWVFILLSGFCWSLGKRKMKRGVMTLLTGFVVSLVTFIFIPENKIMFGILSFIGFSTLFLIPLEKYIRLVPEKMGSIFSFLIFLVLKNINQGYIGIFGLRFVKVPNWFYEQGLGMTFFGFPTSDFYSTDYFPILPWFFLFLCGYYLHKYAEKRQLLSCMATIRSNFLAFMGRHSLLIYLMHQPIIYFIILL